MRALLFCTLWALPVDVHAAAFLQRFGTITPQWAHALHSAAFIVTPELARQSPVLSELAGALPPPNAQSPFKESDQNFLHARFLPLVHNLKEEWRTPEEFEEDLKEFATAAPHSRVVFPEKLLAAATRAQNDARDIVDTLLRKSIPLSRKLPEISELKNLMEELDTASGIFDPYMGIEQRKSVERTSSRLSRAYFVLFSNFFNQQARSLQENSADFAAPSIQQAVAIPTLIPSKTLKGSSTRVTLSDIFRLKWKGHATGHWSYKNGDAQLSFHLDPLRKYNFTIEPVVRTDDGGIVTFLVDGHRIAFRLSNDDLDHPVSKTAENTLALRSADETATLSYILSGDQKGNRQISGRLSYVVNIKESFSKTVLTGGEISFQATVAQTPAAETPKPVEQPTPNTSEHPLSAYISLADPSMDNMPSRLDSFTFKTNYKEIFTRVREIQAKFPSQFHAGRAQYTPLDSTLWGGKTFINKDPDTIVVLTSHYQNYTGRVDSAGPIIVLGAKNPGKIVSQQAVVVAADSIINSTLFGSMLYIDPAANIASAEIPVGTKAVTLLIP